MDARKSAVELAEAIVENRTQAFSSFGRLPGGTLLSTDKVSGVIPPVRLPAPLCACVLDAQLSEDGAAEEAKEIIEHFQGRGLPFVWQTGPGTRPRDLGAELDRCGMQHVFDLSGMALHLDELRRTRVPRGLETTRVSTRDELRGWARAFRTAFGLSEGSERGIADLMRASWEHGQGSWHLYIGMLAEQPVASSAMYLGEDAAGIYFVGTIPAARGRGIGTWMTHLPMVDAREMGKRWSVLHAAPPAQKVYRRMGFKEYCQLGLYQLRSA